MDRRRGNGGGIADNFFHDLLSSDGSSNFEDALAGVRIVVSERESGSLTQSVMDEEIWEALFQMHPNKAPGWDDMSALLWLWGTVGKDLSKASSVFLSN